jgi:hypothetical protein
MPEYVKEVLDKWPDFLEVYETDDNAATRRLKLVVVRRNSRSLQMDQMRLLQHLEDVGLNVVVRVGQLDLTLEQFTRGGTYAAQQTSSPSRQGQYNARSELNSLLKARATFKEDDPRLFNLNRRIKLLEEMLQLGNQEFSRDALEKSDKALRRIEEMVNTPKSKPAPRELSEEFYLNNKHGKFVELYGAGTVELFEAFARKAMLTCKRNVAEYTAHLTLDPANLELRTRLDNEQQLLEKYTNEVEKYTPTGTVHNALIANNNQQGE